MSRKMIIGIIVTLILAGSGVWWFRHQAEQARKAQAELGIQTVTVERRDLSETIDATGNAVLAQNGEIYPAYEATVRQVLHKAGDRVRRGELLMVLETATLKEEWATAESTVKKAEINLAQAQKELERMQKMYAAQGATITEVEAAQKEADVYQEELRLARFNLIQLRQQPDDANFFAPDHGQLWIKAPTDGEIAWVSVKPGQKVTAETLLLTVIAPGAVQFQAEVDESEIDKVRPGQKAVVLLNDVDGTELSGVVTRVGKTGTAESDVVVFPVTIQVDRPTGLRSGVSADVTIYITSYPEALTVPVKAVVERRGQSMVRVRKGSGPEWVRVQLGARTDSYVEVVAGLNEGDQVLIEAATDSKRDANPNRQNRFSPMGGPPRVRVR
jgi:HlyD family secretion protein